MSLDAEAAALDAQFREGLFWEAPSDQNLIAFQAASRARELARTDVRHRFIVVIPVADRPQQLSACLDSLHQLGCLYGYGGKQHLVSVLIADDSFAPENIRHHRQLAAHYAALGLATEYFGLEEQASLRAEIPAERRAALAGVLGVGEGAHKGASAMRNLVYLRLAARVDEHTLCYFIDSDQTFQVRIQTSEGERDVYAIDYFYQLDRIFSHTNTLVLTGKVVGDPPVSPAVMAANFLADVQGFLQQISPLPPQAPCQFHAPPATADEAAYHDMATLFGFADQRAAFSYACPLCGQRGQHTNADALAHFASQLSGFFYGEHPTRKSRYQYQDALESLQAARTVYTGNYCFKPEAPGYFALGYFVPFAGLRLRMAGPVLGRIMKRELGSRFASANLPMLHARTLNAGGALEFRPGIAVTDERVDLSGEQERQFYGDVMLFCIEKLVAMGYPQQTPEQDQITEIYQTTRQDMANLYAEKRSLVMARLSELQTEISRAPLPQPVAMQFQHFIDNITHNFGNASPGYALIAQRAEQRKVEMIAAIAHYLGDRVAWEGCVQAS